MKRKAVKAKAARESQRIKFLTALRIAKKEKLMKSKPHSDPKIITITAADLGANPKKGSKTPKTPKTEFPEFAKLITDHGRFVEGGDIRMASSVQALSEDRESTKPIKVKAFWHAGHYWTVTSYTSGRGNWSAGCYRLAAIDKTTGKNPLRSHLDRTVSFKGTLFRLTDPTDFKTPALTTEEKVWELRKWFLHTVRDETYSDYVGRQFRGEQKDFADAWTEEYRDIRKLPQTKEAMRAFLAKHAPKPPEPIVITPPAPVKLQVLQFGGEACDAIQALLDAFPA